MEKLQLGSKVRLLISGMIIFVKSINGKYLYIKQIETETDYRIKAVPLSPSGYRIPGTERSVNLPGVLHDVNCAYDN